MYIQPNILASGAALVLLAALPDAVSATTSSKRGLVFTPNASWPQDNYIWPRAPSDLTWYYNYGVTPSPVYSNYSQDQFEFVPMLWGAPSDLSDTTFLTTVSNLIKNGRNVSHAMSFNEPDGPAAWGGSDLQPSVAAQVWVNNFIPLQELGVKVGLPACTGGWGGVPWLTQFLGNCSSIISKGKRATQNCTYDFVPIHWYGPFEGLASHIGTYAAAFPNKTIWVTEYNYDNQDLATTQAFYNSSSEYMDRLSEIGRYSLFGAFRSSVSNVGPNGAMLSAGGELTDIGSWYLGGSATGVAPTSKKGSAAGSLAPPFWGGLVVAIAAGAGAVALGGV